MSPLCSLALLLRELLSVGKNLFLPLANKLDDEDHLQFAVLVVQFFAKL